MRGPGIKSKYTGFIIACFFGKHVFIILFDILFKLSISTKVFTYFQISKNLLPFSVRSIWKRSYFITKNFKNENESINRHSSIAGFAPFSIHIVQERSKERYGR